MDFNLMLDDYSRGQARDELVVMAIDVRLLKEELESRREIMSEKLANAVEQGQWLRQIWYRYRIKDLDSDIEAHQKTYKWVMKVAEMTRYAHPSDLQAELKSLRVATRPDVGLNSAGLPWRVRSRIEDAALHLSHPTLVTEV